ncbi:MAG: ribonuclease 3 [bacterium]|nr:MAG: ribonuclease 3 [bacterium]
MLFFWRKLNKHDSAREKLLREFEKQIGYRFHDLELLNTALTHPSYLNENNIKDQPHYERMEFLGDSVVGLIVCGHIYGKFPKYNEGALSDIKSHVVSEKHLASIARRMGIGKYILLGAGEARNGGRRKSSILANVFESVIGAVFLDGGFEKARRYVLRVSKEDIVFHPPDREWSNYKGILQKQCQAYLSADPNYRIVAEKGPSHSRTFEVEVWVKNRKLGGGKGRSKKEAEQRSALASIKYIETHGVGETPKKKEPQRKAKGHHRRSGKKSDPPLKVKPPKEPFSY